jgi:hypothetical protein
MNHTNTNNDLKNIYVHVANYGHNEYNVYTYYISKDTYYCPEGDFQTNGDNLLSKKLMEEWKITLITYDIIDFMRIIINIFIFISAFFFFCMPLILVLSNKHK